MSGLRKETLTRNNCSLVSSACCWRWSFYVSAPEGKDLAETNKNLDQISDLALDLQKQTGIKCLWGTSNLFSHPRYANGAATNPDAHVFAYAAAQVKKAMEITHKLGGENYVFWGGREGYATLLNTDTKRELDHMAAFFHLAIAHKKKIGFGGQLLIEPKPKEPVRDNAMQTSVGPPAVRSDESRQPLTSLCVWHVAWLCVFESNRPSISESSHTPLRRSCSLRARALRNSSLTLCLCLLLVQGL
jgi:hypothetical protein